ncbi:MAG TPA: alginate export family protein [Dokdonella sp.]|uniref:alginate export family protein n=1 Tax=Dokdonella sp. TaxID=2291710 RepID=UPI002D7FEFDB|nr:alginate export family protein [Dokdonella sp.]HET9033097.1 alginate export family protein [Dokdonella sp.]
MNHDQNRPPRLRLLMAFALVVTGIGSPAVAADTAPGSGPIIDLRYRHEAVDDAAFTRNANADTVRLRLGYRWVFASAWQIRVDGEHVQGLFGQHYNSTANGKTTYPVVADPESSELNQAWIGYSGEQWQSRLGRQQVMLDNQRFFGNVGWRQNEQTFDALFAGHTFSGGGPTIGYTYLDRALRVFGHDNPNPLLGEWSLSGNLIHAEQALPFGSLSAYAYLVENNSIATLSTRTLGLRWTGKHPLGDNTLGWALEWSDQSDYANNPLSQSARYHLIEPSLQIRGLTIKAGWEVLGGNGRYGFSTPYATLHAFNGWADRFLSTPVDGLDDRYFGLSGKIGQSGRVSWSTTYHDFRADQGGDAYGHEFDASIGYRFNARFSGLLKAADYHSDGYGSDVRKLWASVEYRY